MPRARNVEETMNNGSHESSTKVESYQDAPTSIEDDGNKALTSSREKQVQETEDVKNGDEDTLSSQEKTNLEAETGDEETANQFIRRPGGHAVEIKGASNGATV